MSQQTRRLECVNQIMRSLAFNVEWKEDNDCQVTQRVVSLTDSSQSRDRSRFAGERR